MNRVGVFTSILETTAAPAAGELSLLTSGGDVVKAGTTGPFSAPTVIDVVVGLADDTYKQVITINPRKFSYKALAYAAAVGKTVRVGYDGFANKLVVVDPTIATNVTKYGTLSFYHQDLTSGVAPAASIHEDIQIVNGDTVTTLYTKLVAAGTKLTAALNAKYGTGSVTFTSGVPVLNATASFLQFVFAKNIELRVTLDGIFDGTPVAVTAGGTGPVISGLTGVEVQAKEKEAAVLDGYNPVQIDKKQMFNIGNYVSAVAGTNYDALLITTTMDKDYDSPGNDTSWDVSAILYADNTTPGTIGTDIAALAAILAELKQNHGGLDVATATTLFAPHA